MSGQRKRRLWPAGEKLRIVLAGLDNPEAISALCRREGINPTLYYGWKRQLLGSAGKIFVTVRRTTGGYAGPVGGEVGAGV